MQGAGALFFVLLILFILISGSWIYVVYGLIALTLLGISVLDHNKNTSSAQSKKVSEVPYASKAERPSGASDESKVADTSPSKFQRKKRWSRNRKRRKMIQLLKRKLEQKYKNQRQNYGSHNGKTNNEPHQH